MALNSAGVHQIPLDDGKFYPNNPGNLNKFMTNHIGDYSDDNDVYPPNTVLDVALATGKGLQWRDDFNGSSSIKDLETALCSGYPVIVRVTSCIHSGGSHFVLVTGRTLNASGQPDFSVADPCTAVCCQNRRYLQSGYGAFSIRGWVEDPFVDNSCINLSLGNNANLLVVDSAGHRTGFDAASGQILQEIPRSTYTSDSILDDETGDISTGTNHCVQIHQPAKGGYRIIVIGLQVGGYNLLGRRFSRDGSSQPPLVFQGSIIAGATNIINIPFDPGADVQSYLVAKGQRFEQNDAGAATLITSNAFRFASFVRETYSNAVTSATVRIPSGTTKTLTVGDPGQYSFGQEFNSKAALDSAFSQGNYVFTIHTRDDGTRAPTLALPADAYPNTPHIANWAAAQSAQADSDFTVTWDAFVGGNTNDYVQLNIDNTNGNSVFQSRRPLVLGALNGADTSVLIPANTMVAGNSYHAHLLFAKLANLNTNGYPGAQGAAAYFAETRFPINAVIPAPPQGRLQFSAATYNVSEAGGMAIITVIRTGGSTDAVSVSFATSDGTAHDGTDYTGNSGVLNFADGKTSQTFSVPIFNDAVFTGTRTILLNLSGPMGGAVLGNPADVVLTIVDDETPPDVTNPVVVITNSPANKSRITNAPVTIQGRASDDVAVAQVVYQVGSGPFQAAEGTDNWSALVQLAPGTNTVRVKSIDTSGNESPQLTRSFVLVLTSPLSLQINGDGTVTPNLNGQSLIVGNSYTMTAKARSGSVFSNWTRDLIFGTPKLTFVMQSNMVLQANFIPNPFTPVKGLYQGLFSETASPATASSGSIFASVTANGKFSARLKFAGKKASLSGQFSSSGASSNSVALSRSNRLSALLQLDLGATDVLTGQVHYATWTADLMAYRNPFNFRTNRALKAGKYTVLFPSSSDGATQPGGDGSGAVTVDSAGNVRLVGMLGDGSKVSQAASLSKQGKFPLFLPLYSGRGAMFGWLTFADAPASGIQGALNWLKLPQPGAKFYADGFTMPVETAGSGYNPLATPVLNFTNGQLWLANGNLPLSFTNQLVLGLNNKVTNQSSNKLALSISVPSGLFKGSVVNPVTGKSIVINGVVLQNQNLGAGCFLGTNQTGSVFFGPR